ncbi:MAG: sugar phosphate isomerase/epimerase, partial [Planctomycetota bacterium]
VELLGTRVWGIHAKDGLPPNRDEALGRETALGEGKVPFSILITRLRELGFAGPVTIEREISGPKQREDIVRAMKLLGPLVA